MSPHDVLASFIDLAPEEDDFLTEVLRGLSQPRKILPCKFFYDAQGSALFERICELPEYYPTRTETALLQTAAAEIAACIGPRAQIVEYGCGAVQKVRILLDALEEPAAYVAVDISKEHLRDAAALLAADNPALEVHAVCADFTKPFRVPRPQNMPWARRIGFFPGSTLGNFTHGQARDFLANAASQLSPGGGMLIGIDLKKDEGTLRAAYNDAAGITAAFNKNILSRINAELGGDFDLAAFRHDAFWNAEEGRIEMHLVSETDQTVRIDGQRFAFRAGESIHTENSYKYSIAEFQALARDAGFEPAAVWTDDRQLFSIHYLEAG